MIAMLPAVDDHSTIYTTRSCVMQSCDSFVVGRRRTWSAAILIIRVFYEQRLRRFTTVTVITCNCRYSSIVD